MKTLYDGKTKTVLLNEDTGVVNLFFKDSATGENGYFDPGFNTVGGSVEGKGKIGLQISKHFFEIMEKNGIHIIDLHKTVLKLDEAANALKQIAKSGRRVLFVATKKQAKEIVAEKIAAIGMPYVTERWAGGMLTNFKTIQSRIARLKEIEAMEADGTFDVLPKKEVINLKKELAKLQKNLGGIKEMKKLPDAIFIVDPKKERICVQEAHTLGIPLIGIADTNCDPEELDYVIPGNDDAIRAVKLIVSKMADAVIEANQGEAADAEEIFTEEAEEAVEE